MAVWNPKIECAKRSEIEAIQLERLKWSVQHAYDHVPMYHDKMVKAGVKPSDIRTLKDISKIPLTTKTELREQYPFKLLAVPMREVVRIHASSGTTGQPITAGYTRRDLDTWAECIARIATAGGATADDIAQISFGYTLFTGAFGLHGGLEKIGCAIIPISSGNTERQINIMRDFGSTVLIATPSYALYMAEVAERMDALKDIRLRVDANQGYNVETALEVLPTFEKLHIDAVEQCLPWWDFDGAAELMQKNATSVKLMLDESIHTPYDAQRASKLHCADYYNIKLMKCGGLYTGAQIADIAQETGVKCMVGCMQENKISITAGVSLVAAKQAIVEADCDSFMFFKGDDDGIAGGFDRKGGIFTLLDKPGLGIDMDI